MWQKKRWSQEESLRTTGTKPPRSLKGRESIKRNPETRDAGKKNEGNSDTLGTGRAHAVTIGDLPSLERFQVHPRGKSRTKAVCVESATVRTGNTTKAEIFREAGFAKPTVTRARNNSFVSCFVRPCHVNMSCSNHRNDQARFVQQFRNGQDIPF